jgi:glycosyltransferase involved in cell wall biosynthesis
MLPRSIAHVITGLETGGAETMLFKLLTATNRERWAPAVVSLRDRGTLGDRIDALDVPVATVDMRGSLPGPRALWRLRRSVTTFAPEIIQGWMYHGNVAALAGSVLRRGRLPLVWCIRSLVFDYASERRFTAWVVRLGALLSHRAVRIVYNSQSSLRQHTELGFAVSGAIVIPNGFDIHQFAPSPEARAAFRQRLGLDERTVLIGRIGRYHRVKDFPGFLEAAAQLAAQRTDVHFVLAGPGVDHENPELGREVARRGLADKVHLVGEVTPISGLMVALDILCSSSAYGESFPNVLGEAMACGVPCVTTDIGDSAWILGSAGLVVPARDPSALMAACRTLVDAGPEGRRQMGSAGRTRIVRDFSLPGVASQYEALYDELLR